MKLLPEHGFCFICGTENPKGLGLRWYAHDDGSVHTSVNLTLNEQGPPGHAHGGVLAAILDEIMGTAAWNAGFMVLAANLTVDFLNPVPLGVPLEISAKVINQEGRKIHTRAEIRLPDEKLATVGKGLFIENKTLFTNPETLDFLKWLPPDSTS